MENMGGREASNEGWSHEEKNVPSLRHICWMRGSSSLTRNGVKHRQVPPLLRAGRKSALCSASCLSRPPLPLCRSHRGFLSGAGASRVPRGRAFTHGWQVPSGQQNYTFPDAQGCKYLSRGVGLSFPTPGLLSAALSETLS